MKIVVAMDSFKGTLSANEACEIVARAIGECVPARRSVSEGGPSAEIVIKPMADGGEGTAQAMMAAGGGRWIKKTVMGPLPEMKVEAGFGWFEKDKSAVVEMAAASGIELLSGEQMNPMKTTTYGTGQLIDDVIVYGAKRLLLAVGGSATVDGGVGAAMALGWKFLDWQGNSIPLGGGSLQQIAKIVAPSKAGNVPVEVLCDVDNPLCGEHGAARVYGPQKGATPEMVEALEKGLEHLAEAVREQLGIEIKNVPGGGAAGGLAAGALAFMNGKLVSGIETVMQCCGLGIEVKSADWVITGEGCFDQQSLYGKVVAGVSRLAVQSGVCVVVLAGQVNIAKEEYQAIGISDAIGCKSEDESIDYAMRNCRELLYAAAQRFARKYLCG
jgi:glycerate kinase